MGPGVFNVPSPAALRGITVCGVAPMCVTVAALFGGFAFGGDPKLVLAASVVGSMVFFPIGVVQLVRYVRQTRRLPVGMGRAFLADLDWRLVVLLANLPAFLIGYGYLIVLAMHWRSLF